MNYETIEDIELALAAIPPTSSKYYYVSEMKTILSKIFADLLEVQEEAGAGAAHPDWANNIRIVSGVIRRPVGGSWQLLGPPGDSGHIGLNIASVTADSNVITINYSVTFVKAITCIAQVDETYRGVYEVGASGGLSSAQISVSRPYGIPSFGGDLDFNGTEWTFIKRYGSGNATVSGGTTKTITITHTGDDCDLNPLKMTHTWDGLPPFTNASLSATASVVRIPASYTPVAGDSIWIERLRKSANQDINPISTSAAFGQNMESNSANIWFLAIGQVA